MHDFTGFSFTNNLQKQMYRYLMACYLIILAFESASTLVDYRHELGQGYLGSRLSEVVIGNDQRIYACSERSYYAFHSNGSIAWNIHLPFVCNTSMAPVLGDKVKMYVVAENRVLIINVPEDGSSPPTQEVLFGPEKGEQDGEDIIGIAVCSITSTIFVNIKNRGLFAYSIRGKLLWSIGPVLSQFGYRLGCTKGVEDCYFASVPVIDNCEATLFISNSAGELYSLSVRTPQYNWVKDLSSFDKDFIITAGNIGLLFVTIPKKSLILAIDVFKGNILWEKNIETSPTPNYAPVVDSHGWVSVGSSDGFLYSISPTGTLRKFPKTASMEAVIRISPIVDCSGYGLFISQALLEGKVTHLSDDDGISVSATRTKGALFTWLNPSTGTVHWSEQNFGRLPPTLAGSDLQHFAIDESILLAFASVTKAVGPLRCRSEREKLVSTCLQAKPKPVGVNAGGFHSIAMFLLFESITLLVLSVLAHFCCIFWRKKKLQRFQLGKFLEKRRELQLKKNAFAKMITDLQQNATDEPIANTVIDKLGDLISERENIEMKLSTTYSLGRDEPGSRSKALLPVCEGRSSSFSFRSSKKESVTIFHDPSDSEGSSDSVSPSQQTEGSSGELGSDDEFLLRKFVSRSSADPTTTTSSSSSKLAENQVVN